MYSEPVTSSDIPLRSEALERMKLWKTPLRCLLVGISGVGKSSAVNTIMHVLLGNTHLVLYAMAVNGVHKGMPGTTWHTNWLALCLFYLITNLFSQYLTLMDTCNDFIDLQKDDIFVSGVYYKSHTPIDKKQDYQDSARERSSYRSRCGKCKFIFRGKKEHRRTSRCKRSF